MSEKLQTIVLVSVITMLIWLYAEGEVDERGVSPDMAHDVVMVIEQEPGAEVETERAVFDSPGVFAQRVQNRDGSSYGVQWSHMGSVEQGDVYVVQVVVDDTLGSVESVIFSGEPIVLYEDASARIYMDRPSASERANER